MTPRGGDYGVDRGERPRREQAIRECGWQGPVRTEFETGNHYAREHLLVLMPHSF
jgi:hypothetical protein